MDYQAALDSRVIAVCQEALEQLDQVDLLGPSEELDQLDHQEDQEPMADLDNADLQESVYLDSLVKMDDLGQ